MEVIDVGTISVDEIVDLLFENDNLFSLVGRHGALCFTLVRPMTAPGFYRQLIENSDTIDATTRRHVAFIVFHGDRSGIVHENRMSYQPYLARHRLQGLSVSGDKYIQLDTMRRRLPYATPSFAPRLAEQLRYHPKEVNYSALAHHMSQAATQLMERYAVRESSLPCLLIVDGKNPKESLTVRLAPTDPLHSLYADVLRPMSEEFGKLSEYWKCRDTLEWVRDGRTRAEKAVVELPEELEVLEQALSQKNVSCAASTEQYREELRLLDGFLAELASNLRDTKSVAKAFEMLPVEDTIKVRFTKLRDEIAALEVRESAMRATCAAEWASRPGDHQSADLVSLTRRLTQKREAFPGRVAKLIQGRHSVVKHHIEVAERRAPAEIRSMKARLEEDLRCSNEYLATHTVEKLHSRAIEVSKREQSLRENGYDDVVLADSNPSAFSAIRSMYRRKLLGACEPPSTDRGKNTMRILFMAANPTTTSPLDLEEELRGLELELKGVKYRDQITLTARHAVRPDDLLRHVRTERPTVIHFSGHGSPNGIVLRSDDGSYTEVSGESLRRFLHGRGVELLVLNACHTKNQADHIGDAVGAIVGTTNKVDDEAARRFTVAFYRSLGDGLSIREAFRDGGDAVALHGFPDVFSSRGELDRVPLYDSGM